jgi:hypothetical protein
MKLISLEFSMDIVANEQKKKVDRVAFTRETNKFQHLKFTKQLNKIVVDAQ